MECRMKSRVKAMVEELAREHQRELGGMSISARRIRRVVNQIGDERVSEREAVIERFKEMDLPQQQVGSTAVEPPQVGVTMMDGGRYQRRDHFGEKDRPAKENHWREDKVGCTSLATGIGPAVDQQPY
jgi:hypothetical protein